MNQSKIFKFIGILIVIIAAVISGILYYKDYQAKKSLPAPYIAGENLPFPTGNRFTISTSQGDVSVKNFYPASQSIIQNEVDFYQSDYDSFSYFPKDKNFQIITSIVTEEDLKQKQPDLEAKFLELLDISKEDACKLSVTISSPQSINPDIADKTFRLSFCK
jgi:hypothetical protein